MYNRVITVVDPGRPDRRLPDLQVGKGSAMLLIVKGIPKDTSITAATWAFVPDDGGETTPYTMTANADTGWWVCKVPNGFFTTEGENHYEISITADGMTFFVGSGIITTI